MSDRPAQPHDPDRRRFFRQFAGDVMSSVGTVLGAAQVLQEQSAEAARELLGTGAADPVASAGALFAGAPAAGAGGEDASLVGYRAPFRWDDDVCRVVDQRRLPETIVELEVTGAADAVNAINDGAIVGAPVQAQVAAVTLAIIAGRILLSRPFARRATIRGAANALRLTRPGSAVMERTIGRMLAVLEAAGPAPEGEPLAAALRAEAEAILRETADAHGALVGHLLLALPDAAGDPLHVLTTGSTGAMGGGQYGTVLSAIQAVHHSGRAIHALVAETRPGFEGSRIAAWELRQAGVPHAVVTDAAAPGCIAEGEAALVLVAADRIAANGDLVATVGTYPLALAAAAAGVPLIACATTAAVDLDTADGDAATVEEGRPARVMFVGDTRVAPQGSQVRNPVQDVTPAALVSAIVTERGVIRPPFADALAGQVAAARAEPVAATSEPIAPSSEPAAPAPGPGSPS